MRILDVENNDLLNRLNLRNKSQNVRFVSDTGNSLLDAL